jgi:acetylornithine deacetylase
MFNGHLDTSLTGQDEHDRSVLGEVHDGFRPRAYLEDGYVRGLGAFNMKGPVACYLAAVEALARTGVRLKGDVIVAGVAGEIEKTPVDTLTPGFSGRLYRGAGCGTRYLAPHGVWADYAIVGEPSALHINTAHPGYCWFKITVRGHFTRTTAIERGVSAVRKMGRVMDALYEWGQQYTARKTAEWEERVHRDDYSVIKPNVNLGAIEGGWPYKPTWSTAICNLFIDVRTLPGDSPLDVQRELTSVLERLKQNDPDLVVSQDMYMSNPGGQLSDRGSYIVTAAANAIERVVGQKPGRVPYAFGSYWCDMNILNRMGIESITLGPGNEAVAKWDGKGEYISVEDMVMGTRTYLAIILDVCNQDREEVRGNRYR